MQYFMKLHFVMMMEYRKIILIIFYFYFPPKKKKIIIRNEKSCRDFLQLLFLFITFFSFRLNNPIYEIHSLKCQSFHALLVQRFGFQPRLRLIIIRSDACLQSREFTRREKDVRLQIRRNFNNCTFFLFLVVSSVINFLIIISFVALSTNRKSSRQGLKH